MRLDMASNSLNLIRLALALFVVISHSYMIGGFEGSIFIGSFGLGFFSVACFFAISGYLISQSRSNSTVKSYLWKRLIRIVPGYLVAYFLTSFLFSPIAGYFNGGWSLQAAASYLTEGLKFFIFGPQEIGATLEGLAHPTSWNGSLWSVRVEAMLYIATAIVFLFTKVAQVRVFTIASFVVLSLASVLFMTGIVIDPTPVGILSTMCLFVPFYLGGSLIYLERERIHLSARLLITAGVLAVIALYTPGLAVLAAVPVGLLVLALGSIRPSSALSHFSRHDYSYGVYVLAFPIQQTLAASGAAGFGLIPYMVLSLMLSLAFAILSWHLVEARALRLRTLVR